MNKISLYLLLAFGISLQGPIFAMEKEMRPVKKFSIKKRSCPVVTIGPVEKEKEENIPNLLILKPIEYIESKMNLSGEDEAALTLEELYKMDSKEFRDVLKKGSERFRAFARFEDSVKERLSHIKQKLKYVPLSVKSYNANDYQQLSNAYESLLEAIREAKG